MHRHSMGTAFVLGAAMIMWSVAGATENEVIKDSRLAELHIQLRGVSQ